MAFPFLPGGALLAIAALGTVLAVFGLALRLVDRAALGFRGTILPGVVRGLEDWADGHLRPSAVTGPVGTLRPAAMPRSAASRSPAAVGGSISAGRPSEEPAIEELAREPDLDLERVGRRRS